MSDAYLRAHPPARSQSRSPRRNRLTGAIAVHTAESVFDNLGPDTGAENVASWMTRRTDPGSYHDLVDSDSTVHLVDYDDEAFHDGTGGNRWSLGLSFACRTVDWARMTDAQRDGFIAQGAAAAARMAAHVKARTGVVIPARRITAAQYRAGAAGFVSHAELDPGRRSDPGNGRGQFPWDDFLAEFARLTATPAPKPPTGGFLMALTDNEQRELLVKTRRIDAAIAAGVKLHPKDLTRQRVLHIWETIRGVGTAAGMYRRQIAAAVREVRDETKG